VESFAAGSQISAVVPRPFWLCKTKAPRLSSRGWRCNHLGQSAVSANRFINAYDFLRDDGYCGLIDPTAPPQSPKGLHLSVTMRVASDLASTTGGNAHQTKCYDALRLNASIAVCDDTENQSFQTRNALLIASFPSASQKRPPFAGGLFLVHRYILYNERSFFTWSAV
jgi:hypothetical protein